MSDSSTSTSPEIIKVKQQLHRISTTIFTTLYWKCITIEEAVIINTATYHDTILVDFEDSDPSTIHITHAITRTKYTDLNSDVFGVPPFCFGEADSTPTTVEYFTEEGFDQIPELTHTH